MGGFYIFLAGAVAPGRRCLDVDVDVDVVREIKKGAATRDAPAAVCSTGFRGWEPERTRSEALYGTGPSNMTRQSGFVYRTIWRVAIEWLWLLFFFFLPSDMGCGVTGLFINAGRVVPHAETNHLSKDVP